MTQCCKNKILFASIYLLKKYYDYSINYYNLV